MTNQHIGSSFHDFLKVDGFHDEAYIHAVRRVLAWQVEKAMTEQGLSRNEMAKRMKSSHAQLSRLLDPKNGKVQLDTLQRAAAAVGRNLRIELS